MAGRIRPDAGRCLQTGPGRTTRRRHWAGLLAAVALPFAPAAADPLRDGFVQPPPSAEPRVWWHWMDGNVSIPGIDADLAWMDDSGIGGVQNFDGSQHLPLVVPEAVRFASPEWMDAIRHAVDGAVQRDMEFTIASAPGWSQTGGPWVQPEQAMKKLVWSELDIAGGTPVAIRLPLPPDTPGPFQDVPGGGAEPSNPPPPAGALPRLYRDAITVAYRVPAPGQTMPATISASASIAADRLTDHLLTAPVELPVSDDRPAWIRFDYHRRVTLRAVTIALEPGQRVGPIFRSWPTGAIEASDDGETYRPIASLPLRGAPQQTIAFPATTARYFRIVLKAKWVPGPLPLLDFPQPAPTVHRVMEARFTGEGLVHRFEDKAGWSTIADVAAFETPLVPRQVAVRRDDVVDVSAHVDADGTLRWTPPPGHWRVLRLGWSLTGKLNNPASPEGTGLEVDKLNARSVDTYLRDYLALYRRAVGAEKLGQNGIGFMLNDSYEALAANWTDNMLAEFRTRRGYDPLPWLPVLTGRIVESAESSDRFLWDYRRTLADLIRDNHYRRITDTLHGMGMGHYAESHEFLRAFVGDGMEVKRDADVPMGATWVSAENAEAFLPDIRESASVAHLYGQNLVAAESFTTMAQHYAWPPAKLKATADLMMANGLNRFMIHTSVHQPDDRPGPGLGLGAFGQWFTRKETWAPLAGAWMHYLARSSFLLQQGQNVADVAWFYGEDDNITQVYQHRAPDLPAGLNLDFVNAETVQQALRVRDGNIVAPSGTTYRILVIDPRSNRMTLATLRSLAELAEQGGVIVGPEPLASPSLADDQAAFRRLATDTWRRWAGRRIFAELPAALSASRVEPDVDFGDTAGVAFVHRVLPSGDIYYLLNLDNEPKAFTASFRAAGTAEIWRADSGSTIAATSHAVGDRTSVALQMAARDAVFIVLRKDGEAGDQGQTALPGQPLQTLSGAWDVSFAGSCAGGPAVFDSLHSWSADDDPAIRYYSGRATYRTSFDLDAASATGPLQVDLGAVRDIARVRLNGQALGTAWKAPFVLDVGSAAKAGRNTLEVDVANAWPNRLIGDKVEQRTQPCAHAAYDPYTATDPLLPAGLLGPVRIMAAGLPGQSGEAR